MKVSFDCIESNFRVFLSVHCKLKAEKSSNLFEILAHWRKWFGPIVRGVIENASITYNNFDINWFWHNAECRENAHQHTNYCYL